MAQPADCPNDSSYVGTTGAPRKSWIIKTLVETAQAISDGKEKGSKKLAGLINCGGCDAEFKK